MQEIINQISLWALPIVIITILTVAMIKNVPVYEEFTEGAKEGFKVAVTIIPYLIAIIVGISMFQASGAIEMISKTFSSILTAIHVPSDIIPIMIVRPLSGSAALGVFSNIASTPEMADYTIKLAAVMVGSSETTFYVLSVYFGAVGIKRFRYAIWVGILADIIAAILAITVCSWMFLK